MTVLALAVFLLAGCSSGSQGAPPAATNPTSTPAHSSGALPEPSGSASGSASASDKPPVNDNDCGPVEICGSAAVTGGQTLTTKFFSVLSELNNKRCGDWAKGTDDGKQLSLPKINNTERTLVFFSVDPIAYHGPGRYTDVDLLKDATLTVNDKTYEKGKGKAEVVMSDKGDGSVILTDWTTDGGSPVSLKANWTCTNR